MTRESKESVLSRWSRRKLETQEIEEALQQEAESAPLPDAEAGVETTPALTDADMPDLDTLDENSDYSGFMSEGVSEELRRLALRKLFRSSVFNIRDGLDEYDEDFTTFEKLGDIVTCDMKHQIEMEQERLREKLAAGEELTPDEQAALEDGIAGDVEDDIEDDVEDDIEADFDEDSVAAIDEDKSPTTVAAATSTTRDKAVDKNE